MINSQFLIQKISNIDAISPTNGQTALHVAIIKGKKENVALLLAANADFNIPDSTGKTAQDYDSESNFIKEYYSSLTNPKSFSM